MCMYECKYQLIHLPTFTIWSCTTEEIEILSADTIICECRYVRTYVRIFEYDLISCFVLCWMEFYDMVYDKIFFSNSGLEVL